MVGFKGDTNAATAIRAKASFSETASNVIYISLRWMPFLLTPSPIFCPVSIPSPFPGTADEFIMKEGVGNIVFDFEDTRFMDSSGIGAILGRYKRMREIGGRVAVCMSGIV